MRRWLNLLLCTAFLAGARPLSRPSAADLFALAGPAQRSVDIPALRDNGLKH